MSDTAKKLGLLSLTSIVFSSILGGGIYNLPQNMAAHAGLGAVAISWLVTAVGMVFMVLAFKYLSDRHPSLNAGIYQYAGAGFGDYSGFLAAWSYWLCPCMGNVVYAIMLNDSLGAFFPRLLHHGWPTLAIGSALIWSMYYIVTRGLWRANVINIIITGVKILSFVSIVALLFVFCKLDMLELDFWGEDGDLGSVGQQVRSTMLVTLWCFTGIEGALMMSSHARRSKDVGRAGIIGFLSAWLLYVMVSVLAFGIMRQPELASLHDPSVAYVLKASCGDWAYYFILTTIIVSILGGAMSWTLVCAEVPYGAARARVYPPRFLKLNKHGQPAFSLFTSTIVMQMLMLLVVFSEHVYMGALELCSLMALPAYIFTGLFIIKNVIQSHFRDSAVKRCEYAPLLYGCGVTLFCGYIVVSTSWRLLLVATLLMLPGTWVFLRAMRRYHPGQPLFTPVRTVALVVIWLVGLAGLYLLATSQAGF